MYRRSGMVDKVHPQYLFGHKVLLQVMITSLFKLLDGVDCLAVRDFRPYRKKYTCKHATKEIGSAPNISRFGESKKTSLEGKEVRYIYQ